MNSATSPSIKRVRLAFAAMILAVAALASFAGPAAATSYDSDTPEPCTLDITPKSADNPLGAVHTVTATVTHKGWFNPNTGRYDSCTETTHGAGPLPGITVDFEIVSGPNTGLKGSAVTDANGNASWQWVSNVAGTDTVKASITHYYCEEFYDFPGWNWNLEDCPSALVTDTDLQNGVTAIKNWIPDPPPPNPPVIIKTDPSVLISFSKKCVTTKFTVRANMAGDYAVTRSVLYVDGKKVKTNKSGKFTINTARYSSKNHSFKVVTTFENGTVITKKGKFKLCKSRLTSRKLDPRFTG